MDGVTNKSTTVEMAIAIIIMRFIITLVILIIYPLTDIKHVLSSLARTNLCIVI